MSEEELDPASRRTKKVLLASAIAMPLCCLLTVPLGLTVANDRWDEQVRAELDALDAEGLGVRPGELLPAAPPDAENGALLIAPALGALAGLPAMVDLSLGTQPELLAKALAEPGSVDAELVFTPEPSDPTCPADLTGALDLVDSRLTPQVLDAVDAAVACDRWVFPVDWTKGFTAELPHLMELKQLMSGLILAAGRAQIEGRSEVAWAHAERLLGLVHSLDREPTLISYLVRTALASMALQCVEQLLRLGPPPPEERRARLEAAARSIVQEDGWTFAMRGEAGMFLTSATEDPSEFLRDEALLGTGDLLARMGLRIFYHRWRADYVRVMARTIRAGGGAPVEVQAELSAIMTESQRGSMFVVLMVPALEKAYSKELRLRAKVALVAEALRLVGRDPFPEVLEGLPADPWSPSGAPLRYVRKGPREALLWSVGEDAVDDSGTGGDPDAGVPPGAAGTDQVVRVKPR